MSELFYGKIGKDKSEGLLSDKRIVVYKGEPCRAEFIPVDTIADAQKLFKNPSDEVYYWDNGDWQEILFLVQGNTPTDAIGFKPRQIKGT